MAQEWGWGRGLDWDGSCGDREGPTGGWREKLEKAQKERPSGMVVQVP